MQIDHHSTELQKKQKGCLFMKHHVELVFGLCYIDPTAGPSAADPTTWCLDENALHENIKKTLSKFCIPSPMVLR